MFEAILQWIRKAWNTMFKRDDVQKVMGIELAVSDDMVKAITDWSNMYINKASWLVDNQVFSLNIPAAMSAEISRVATIEMKVSVEGSTRADFINEQLIPVMSRIRENVEYGAAKGGLIFKPYIEGTRVAVDVVQADSFYPLEFDGADKITSCIFVDLRILGGKYYTRLEHHLLGPVIDDDEVVVSGYTITNKVFRSDDKDALGSEVALTEVPDWADLEPVGVISGVDQPLFGYFRYPLANNIDTTSPIGVSCFARAVDLIQQADELWSEMLWEFDSGKRALYIDTLAFGKDTEGNPVLPNSRLYRTLNMSGDIGEEDMFHEWTPEFREANYLRGIDAILRKIEYNGGLDYGRLSNPDTVDKTAKEISSSQQRFFSTIRDIQKSLDGALKDLIYAIDAWITVEGLTGTGAFTTSIEFDDSIVVDTNVQFDQDSRAVNMFVMDRVEFRMRNYGEDEATAKKKIDAIVIPPPPDFFGAS